MIGRSKNFLPDRNYNVEALWFSGIGSAEPAICFGQVSGQAVCFAVCVSLSSLANCNDIVGDESGFSCDHQSHGNPFRFVVVAAMHQVSYADCRAKTKS
jgi:hypothetical protein